MKKISFTIVLSGIFFTAFAQKMFKPIHFTSYMQTQKSLDFNGDKDGPEQHVSGLIQVNAKDSLFTISVDTQVALKLKILTIGDEFADGQYDKVVQVSCMDDAGKKIWYQDSTHKNLILHLHEIVYITGINYDLSDLLL
ncbi:hypothetical protein [Mucilaginibacter sp.]|uniref:hypothetical protein n=1 Tax=Mucilaginibacter sp. TaxID=1882438 RepID=UPI002845B345|nr:hypothetical protein [Mucilaginibacter sp.]MDR3694603.1 hypothetical protein [Mucilaginibacter sp.]